MENTGKGASEGTRTKNIGNIISAKLFVFYPAELFKYNQQYLKF
jgi:hypothetical protein